MFQNLVNTFKGYFRVPTTCRHVFSTLSKICDGVFLQRWLTYTSSKPFSRKAPSYKSSRLEVFCEKGVFKNFIKFIGKQLCQSLFFNKVAGLRQSCFLINFTKFLRTPFLQNTSGGCF